MFCYVMRSFRNVIASVIQLCCQFIRIYFVVDKLEGSNLGSDSPICLRIVHHKMVGGKSNLPMYFRQSGNFSELRVGRCWVRILGYVSFWISSFRIRGKFSLFYLWSFANYDCKSTLFFFSESSRRLFLQFHNPDTLLPRRDANNSYEARRTAANYYGNYRLRVNHRRGQYIPKYGEWAIPLAWIEQRQTLLNLQKNPLDHF